MTRRDATVVGAWLACALLVACAALNLPQSADAAAQVKCVAENDARPAALACICAVRAQYDAGPQCDAGWQGGDP